MVRQSAYINGNVYLKGADSFDREKECYKCSCDPEVSIVEEGDAVYLEMTLPHGMFEVRTEIISTEKLGMARIPEAVFDNPDGSICIIQTDLNEQTRNTQPKAGPIEDVHEGRNRIKIWSRKLRISGWN